LELCHTGLQVPFIYQCWSLRSVLIQHEKLKQQQHLPLSPGKSISANIPVRLACLGCGPHHVLITPSDLDRYQIICKSYKDHTEHRFLTNAYTYIVAGIRLLIYRHKCFVGYETSITKLIIHPTSSSAGGLVDLASLTISGRGHEAATRRAVIQPCPSRAQPKTDIDTRLR
jgi:hypothetical protein